MKDEAGADGEGSMMRIKAVDHRRRGQGQSSDKRFSRCWEPISQSRNSHRFGSKLRRTKYTLIRWSKLKDHVKNQRKIELQRRIEYYQGKQLTKEELSDSKDCKKELDVTWENEERYWHQGRESTGCNIVTRSGLKTLMRWSSTFNNTSKEFTQGIRRSTMVGWRT
ncbi:hypothetical protein V6N13_047004 [Hibiscus sabdariffa]